MGKEDSSYLLLLLRCSLGTSSIDEIPILKDEDWRFLWKEAQRQTISGLLWPVIEQLSVRCKPPHDILFQWYASTERIKRLNSHFNEVAAEITSKLQKDGFSPVILKGQGLAILYPDRELRTPGDIDIWLNGKRNYIVQYMRERGSTDPVRYNNIGMPVYKGVAMEAHPTPSWMNTPWLNYRMQLFFRENFVRQTNHLVSIDNDRNIVISTPTIEFNAVFILLHIFRHLLGEGIGMRQVVDYYYVLLNLPVEKTEKVRETLRYLGLSHFASAMMYVMQEGLGLNGEKLIVQADERAGLFLLEEILKAGNFGKKDPRIKRKKNEKSYSRFLRSLRRNVKFVRFFPAETLFDPLFKIWHYIWQLVNGYR